MKDLLRALSGAAFLSLIILVLLAGHSFEAQAAGTRLMEEEDEDDGDPGFLKDDEFDAVVYEARDPGEFMELPSEYDGLAALHRTKERRLQKGFIRIDRRRWYWVSKDDEAQRVRIKLGEAESIQLSKSRETLEELFPELVYEIRPKHTYKQGDKVRFYGRIYGNKKAQYKIVFGEEGAREPLYTGKDIVPSNSYILKRSIKLSLLLDPGEYYAKLYLDENLTKEIKITLEPRDEDE